MPREIKKTVYTFAELQEAAKDKNSPVKSSAVERAAQWLRECQTHGRWWEYTEELWENALDQIGFTNAQIAFSGFWSQGDGASFTANVDLDRLIDFMSTAIEGSDCVTGLKEKLHGYDEDFRAYIVKKTGFVADQQYRKL